MASNRPVRQAPAATDHAHTGTSAQYADRRQRARTLRWRATSVSQRPGLDHHQVAGQHGCSEPGGRNDLGLDVGALQAADERTAAHSVVIGVDRQHGRVAAAQHRLADEVGPADARTPWRRRATRRRARREWGRASSSIGQARPRPGRVGGGEHGRAQPPHRARRRMPLDDAPAGDDEACRVEPETAQCTGRLADQHPLIAARGPGYVAQPFDGMHHRDATATLGRRCAGALPSAAVASNPALDTTLTALGGESRPLEEWLTTFHLASVILDPYTNESSWVLKTAARILESLRGTDVRVNFVVTADAERRQSLSRARWPTSSSCTATPTGRSSSSLGLVQLPAFVFIRVDGTCQPAPRVGTRRPGVRWPSRSPTRRRGSPDIPVAGDPGPFHGTPALG